ncbi:hypothetical protein ACFL1L_05525 [Thermoplasmatota archaeon]
MIVKYFFKIISCLTIFLLISLSIVGGNNVNITDHDPLVDIEITIDILQIRSLEKKDMQIPAIEKIDLIGSPDFYIKLFVNEEEFTSQIWEDQKYIYDPDFSVKVNVPDEDENVDIRIQLWDWNQDEDVLCDISPFDYELPDTYEVELVYNIKSGHWRGDDYCDYEPTYFDLSGYGRLNGCDDGSIYQLDRDCEIIFNIYQNDYDNDGIPYWSEVEVFGTDPTIADLGDPDNDGVPVYWEYKWGHIFGWRNDHYWIYNPFEWDDHENFDPDDDGLSNIEEFLMEEWRADPFRRDVFVELDTMECSPDGDLTCFPETSIEILNTVFNRQNILLHIDSGLMGGSDVIPYDEETSGSELDDIYWKYFIGGDNNNSREGIFHYGVVVYNAKGAPGYVFRPDAFQISILGLEEKVNLYPWLKYDTVFASAYMHELGHTFAFSPIPGHNEDSKYPWQIGWWLVRSYKSCMNYAYMYYMVDYSDGSHGKNDFDDWERMDMTYFQRYWD